MARSSSLTGRSNRSVRGSDVSAALAEFATSVPATIAAAGQTAWMSSEEASTVILAATIAGFTGGTSPGITFLVETADEAGGNVATAGTTGSITAAGTTRIRATGLDHQWRIRWTLTGAPTSVNGVAVAGATK